MLPDNGTIPTGMDGKHMLKTKKPAPRNKRDQIVKAATRVFLKHGYDGTSVALVAEKAGVIKATIYSHFADKRALFKAIMEDLTVEKGVFELESAARSVTPREFFHMIAAKMSERSNDPQFKSLIRVVIGESGRFPELSQLFYETLSCRANRLVASYIANHPEFHIPDPEAAAQVITGSFVYWTLSQEIMGGKFVAPMEQTRIVAALESLFLDRLE